MIEKDWSTMFADLEEMEQTAESISPKTNTQLAIQEECKRISNMLISKNKSYGNSVLEPVRVFSKSDAIEQIKVRIDDKLSRIERGSEFIGDDTLDDLIGYLVLLSIAQKETWK
jgi:hypothetical protein